MSDQIEQRLWRVLRDVIEPDLGENIVDLGLVRSIRVGSDADAKIDITMTTRYSPHADAIVTEVERAALHADVAGAVVRVMADPDWTPYRMAEPLRVLLGLPASEPEPPVLPAPSSWRDRIRRRLSHARRSMA